MHCSHALRGNTSNNALRHVVYSTLERLYMRSHRGRWERGKTALLSSSYPAYNQARTATLIIKPINQLTKG